MPSRPTADTPCTRPVLGEVSTWQLCNCCSDRSRKLQPRSPGGTPDSPRIRFDLEIDLAGKGCRSWSPSLAGRSRLGMASTPLIRAAQSTLGGSASTFADPKQAGRALQHSRSTAWTLWHLWPARRCTPCTARTRAWPQTCQQGTHRTEPGQHALGTCRARTPGTGFARLRSGPGRGGICRTPCCAPSRC